jgi:hypothetical protein
MDKSLDIAMGKRIIKLIEENNITRFTLTGILKCRISSFNDMLSGISPWRLEYISALALYFNVTTDWLIFGDNDFIKKNHKKRMYQFKQDIKDFLVREEKFKTYGELTASGFFDEIKT